MQLLVAQRRLPSKFFHRFRRSLARPSCRRTSPDPRTPMEKVLGVVEGFCCELLIDRAGNRLLVSFRQKLEFPLHPADGAGIAIELGPGSPVLAPLLFSIHLIRVPGETVRRTCARLLWTLAGCARYIRYDISDALLISNKIRRREK